MDFFKSAIASAISQGPLPGYTIAERVDFEQSIWSLNNGFKKEGNLKCSIFTFDVNANKSRLPLAKNAVRKCRTLRHPGVIKVIDTVETDAFIYVVTERLTPLAWYTRRKSLAEETLKWGLFSVAKTVRFINEEASSVHGVIRTSSIFTSEAGEWKLGAFDILSSMKDDDAVIYSYGTLIPESGRFMPPEVGKSGWDTIKRNPLPAVDAYGYGTLIHELFSGPFTGHEQALLTKTVPGNMSIHYKRLLNANPKLRLTVGGFVDQGRRNGGFFNTPLITLTEGIDSLGLKSEGERDQFLSELDDIATLCPEEYLQRRILPELLKSVEFGGGGAKVFGVVLRIGGQLSDEDYDSQITPVLVRLFASQDRALRVCLLDNLPVIIDHLPGKLVNDKIFPNLVTGFTDLLPVVREQTVKSVLTIIPKLSERVINGDLLKYLAKTANDEQPGIRTNTTICLGKIAKYLGPSTRTKVLVAAFTRSLRDPFVHARNAALMALAATADIFTEEDCATKILPAICASLLDQEKIVRDTSNKTFDVYLNKIRKHATTLPDNTPIVPSTRPSSSLGDANTSSAVPRMGTPGTDSSSWAGWAISSFTNKLATADGVLQPKAASTTSTSAPMSRVSSSTPTPTFSPPPSQHHADRKAPPAFSRTATETTKLAQSFSAPEAAEEAGFWDEEAGAGGEDGDAWGAMAEDDDGDVHHDGEEGEEEEESREEVVKASTAARATRTTTAVKSNSRPALDNDDEPDFAGWLKAQQGASKSKPLAKALPKALPKGLTTTTAGKTSSAGGSTPAVVRKPAATVVPARSSAGAGASGVPAKATPTVVPSAAKKKAVVERKKQVDEEEGWGDAWD